MNPQQKKHQLAGETTVNAPATAVWEVLADFSAVSTWAPSVVASYALDNRERGTGAARHCDIKGFGSIDEVVTDWDEGHGFTYEVTPLGPIGGADSTWRVEPIDANRSRVQVRFGWETRFGLFGALMNLLMMRRKLRQGLTDALRALKKRVETGTEIRLRTPVQKAA